ncbi:MAG: YbjQ family protein [Balneolaceae bacterium]|nr:YbjQ family protein [Balneolaceae bacterium]
MLITTNDYFQGKEIEAYLGQVNEQIVIGANIFRDVFASFRDVFGGQTKGYKKELDKLKQAAINGLEQEAKKLQANGVIGFNMDLDEISGGSKSMFMLNVYGTAVKFADDEKDKESSQIEGAITSEKLEYEVTRKELKEKIEDGSKPFSQIGINELTEFKIYGVLNEGIEELGNAYADDEDLTKYIEIVPQKEIEELLFQKIQMITSRYWNIILTALENRNWFNSKLILKLLQDDDPIRRFRGLQLCEVEKDFYKKDDIQNLSNISDFVKSVMNSQIKTVVEEGTFKKHEKWICPRCLRKLSMDMDQCNCGSKNRYGLTDYSPKELIDTLSKRAEVLKEHFA